MKSISWNEDNITGKAPYCHTNGPCFAKRESLKGNGVICVALSHTYDRGKACPFQKAERGDE